MAFHTVAACGIAAQPFWEACSKVSGVGITRSKASKLKCCGRVSSVNAFGSGSSGWPKGSGALRKRQ